MNIRRVRAWLKTHRVAVLKGGWSSERAISLKTGEAVENALHRMKLPFTSIDVQPTIVDVLKKKKVQFCFICLHGSFGEDGQIQSLLDKLCILYTGSGAIASSLAMRKDSAKALFRLAGIPTPQGLTISKSLFNKEPHKTVQRIRSFFSRKPLFLKPVDHGSAIGAFPVNKKSDLKKALKYVFQFTQDALVEEFLSGREITVGILGSLALPVIEIIPEHEFYDYHSKYAAGGSRHVIPAPLSKQETEMAKELSKKAFIALGCEGYGRIDFIRTQKGKFFILEVNTIPGLTDTSLLPEAARAAGIEFEELILRLASLALNKK